MVTFLSHRPVLYGTVLALLLMLISGLQANSYSPRTVNAQSEAKLQASLEAIIGDLSRKDRKAFMIDFFTIAYVSNPEKSPYLSDRMWGRNNIQSWAERSAEAFLADRRMDPMTPAAAYTLHRQTGHSDHKSYYLFLENYGDVIDGLSGHTVQTRARITQPAHTELPKIVARAAADVQLAEERLKALTNNQGSCNNPIQNYRRAQLDFYQRRLAALEAGQEPPAPDYGKSPGNFVNVCPKVKKIDHEARAREKLAKIRAEAKAARDAARKK